MDHSANRLSNQVAVEKKKKSRKISEEERWKTQNI